ncbi:signal recognition particle-docking protein FtsY [Neorhizobium sp. T786]|uniref:signal recognition particle-docking protein FtsY n=1 Tax=Pseudorhizobium xiangyangii TaxID=2883104 RepID=UPI001CFFAD47|nr:signal recognition particle-docking protein FtsY [Neorhizobium xiangyangii]MCB5202313.1 signal recognition particle-docking protein FtsY [Neorhizobium xiangyangii]
MALSFIKRVFTFGDKPAPVVAADAPAPLAEAERLPSADAVTPVQPTAEEAQLVRTDVEPHFRDDPLPVAEADPVATIEMETTGGPAADDAVATVVEAEPVEEEVAAILPGAEETSDLGVVPLSLLEAEAAAETENAPVTGAPLHEQSEAASALSQSEGSADPAVSEPVLPKGFSTAKDETEAVAIVPLPKLSWYQRLRAGLARTSSQLTGQISALFTKRKLDDETLEDLEDLLIQSDLGVETAMRITGALSSERYGKDVTGEDVSRIMAAEIAKVLGPVARPLQLDLNHKPHVILVVGVNGTGKTTTIGKLAAKLSGSGLKVMLAAGDTFRAAAIEQLKIWADRTGSEFICTKLGADAAGLAYDAYEQARANKSDVLIIDTAGRLQNKAELMAELEKIVRVLGKLDPDAPHTVLQTLDATTGQNALQQVEIFRNVAGVSGLIMTKLDGTARGGILVGIAAKHKLPVYFIGVGEGIDDLEPFEAQDFADAIAGVTH